jgi:hypothetical protein
MHLIIVYIYFFNKNIKIYHKLQTVCLLFLCLRLLSFDIFLLLENLKQNGDMCCHLAVKMVRYFFRCSF